LIEGGRVLGSGDRAWVGEGVGGGVRLKARGSEGVEDGRERILDDDDG